ncbi:CDGSH iron-sulfur domain-containing protein [Pontiella desulfatans]|uniref:CDGSH iron-sulfur domain-containing protein n=1 Tax=Pontiella desulfatans TaxID=2750659 RepID=UPI00109D7025
MKNNPRNHPPEAPCSDPEKDAPTNCSSSKMALCRCGHSRNKPFCDYSHAEKGWKE